MLRLRIVIIVIALFVCASIASADVIITQNPVNAGGVTRSSQLWIDPSPAGNDSDSDAKCWTDFHLTSEAQLDHIEWWGSGAWDQGFTIEFWKQDPGTIAYQPLAVFDGQPGKLPEGRFTLAPADISTTIDNGGLTHYIADLPSVVDLAANDLANPRWFVGIVGLTNQFSSRWYWSQGTGAGQGTFQWNRGSFDGAGPGFRSMGDKRAMEISGTIVPEPAAIATLIVAAGASLLRRRPRHRV